MPSFVLVATPLAWPYVGLIALVVPPVLLWNVKNGSRREFLLLALFAASLAFVVLAQSVLAFVCAWETMALLSTLLVAIHHEQRFVRRAALSYAIMSQVATACILAAFALLAAHAHGSSFAQIARAASSLPADVRAWALTLALIGFGSKAGLVPLHFWLPSAHPAAPSGASALLSGVMLAIAVYGLALFGLTLAAPVPPFLGLTIVALGALSAVLGALYAAVDTDMKRLLAYSSIENTGISICVLGLAFIEASIGNAALAAVALVALFIHGLSHGFFKSLLFLGSGGVLHATGTTDLEHLGGVFRVLRFSTPLILVGAMGASSLPPTSGFASEWLLFRTFIDAAGAGPIALRIAAAFGIAALGTASGLTALAFAKFFGIGFLGKMRSSRSMDAVKECIDTSVVGLALLALMVLLAGLAPALLLAPLVAIARAVTHAPAIDVGALPSLPAEIAALPLLGAIATVVYAHFRKTRAVATWTCGSNVTARSQYTATAFAKPISLILRIVLRPSRERIIEEGSSWLPHGIRYVTSLRYPVDEAARSAAAFFARLARRLRIVQAGMLRVYLLYAVVAVIVVLMVAR